MSGATVFRSSQGKANVLSKNEAQKTAMFTKVENFIKQ